MPAYYNEIDPYCVQWLRNLITAGHLPPGDVDDRDIRDVKPDDLKGYGQVHLFAGIGGFGLGLRMAGWPDDRPIWTGGYPCQPFSVAGKQGGTEDDRHLWPEMYRLVAECRPRWLIGENVAGHIAMGLDGVLSDLEASQYTARTFAIPACAVDAPHRRERVWIVAHAPGTRQSEGRSKASGPIRHKARRAESERRSGPVADAEHGAGGRGEKRGTSRVRRLELLGAPGGAETNVADSDGAGPHQLGVNQHREAELRHGQEREPGPGGGIRGGEDVGNASGARPQRRDQRKPAGENGQQGGRGPGRSSWSDHATVGGRRVKPGVCLLAHGIPQRVAKLRAFGNAVVPQVVAEVARAMMEAEP